MAAALASGGVLVIADIVRPPDARGLAVAAQQWDEAVRARALALDGDPIDKPSSLAEQLAWLAEAGFAGVDAHWLVAGHAIFSGRKP